MSTELSEEYLRARFEKRVVPYLESQRVAAPSDPDHTPTIVFTGAQPGAGKSRANERVARDRPGLVPVVGDDLRQFHPDFARLMRDDPLAMPDATAQASGRWIGMSADYLRAQRADVLIETTLRSPDAMANTLKDFRRSGYAAELRAVAVPEAVSRLSTVERYTRQVDENKSGRWTAAKAHDEAFAKGPGTVRQLIASGAIDRFTIEDRAGKILFERRAITPATGRAVADEAAQAFDRARSIDQLTPQQARGWLDLAHAQIAKVGALADRDRSLDLQETVHRIGTHDAPAIAVRAYPDDPARASQASERLRAAAAALGTPGPSASRDLTGHGMSFPRSPSDAVKNAGRAHAAATRKLPGISPRDRIDRSR